MLKIKKALVTNTRLMGVVGLIIYYEKYVEIYHLGFEEYGIDGYFKVKRENKNKVDKRIKKITGGLGGNLLNIKPKEAKFLLKEAYNINYEYLVDRKKDYKKIKDINVSLNDSEKSSLYKKICVNLKNDNELINYYIMRIVANDIELQNYLTKGNIEIQVVDKPSTLLKNEITKETDDNYLVKSLISYKNKYLQIFFIIKVINKKIKLVKIKEQMEISAKEASFILSQPEYLLVYNIDDKDFEKEFYKSDYKMTKNLYDNGTLYTKYKETNKHVAKSKYFLRDDIYALFYFVNGQLIIAAFEQKNIEEIINEFEKKSKLTLNGDIKVDQSIIYQFINSKSKDIYKFLNFESRD
ncbi:MAG: hypothetical protein ACQEQE_05635 [Bacillota bacterium]